ncbi:MAG: cobalamin biosynthesis protein [Bdellovibrionales bacterium]
MIDFITQWHAALFDPDRIPLAVAAIVVCAVIGMIAGPLAGNANPFIWQVFDILFGKLGGKLDKPQRPKADLVFRGFIVTACVMLIALTLGKGLTALLSQNWMVEGLALSVLLTSGTVWFALLRLYFAMDGNKKGKGGYYAIARSTRTNLSAVDDYAITRCGINFAARSFDKGLVAPVTWYVIAGLPGACVYAALAAMAWRFGKDGFTKGFGAAPLALEKLMGFVPNILSGLIITLAGTFTPTAKLHTGLTAWLGHKNRASYAQGGFALSAMAWSLNLSLGGPSQDLNGDAIKAPWVGPDKATAKNDHKHLRRAIIINVLAHIVFIAVLLGMYLWAGVLDGRELAFLKL